MQNKVHKTALLPFCTSEEEKVLFPLARLEENILVHLCCFYGNRAGPVSGDSMCDLCGSLTEYINPVKHTTLIPCSRVRRKTPNSHVSAKENLPRPGMGLDSPRVKPHTSSQQ